MLEIWATVFSEVTHLFPNSQIKWMLTCTDGRNCTLGLVVVVIRYAVRSTPKVIAVYLDVTVLSGISVVLLKIR